MTAMRTTNTAVTTEEITACEHRVGRRLPAAFREFLLQRNGGRPVRDIFAFNDGKRLAEGGVDAFLGVGSFDESIERYLDEYRGRIPEDLFPIAHDAGDNLILIGAEGANAGKVFFWHHELEADEGEPPTYDNAFLIADTFEAFLASLHE